MESLFCFLAFLIAVFACLWATRLIVQAKQTDDQLFKTWRDIFVVWDHANTLGKQVWFIIAFGIQLVRTLLRLGRWGVLSAFYAAMVVLVGMQCEPQWPPILKEVRDMLRDLYEFVLHLRETPEPVKP